MEQFNCVVNTRPKCFAFFPPNFVVALHLLCAFQPEMCWLRFDAFDIFSFLEMNDLEVVFLETYPSFPSNNPKMHPKCNHKRRRKHTTCSTKSRELFRNGPFHVLRRYEQKGTYNNEI